MKVFNTKLWRILMMVFIALTAILIAVTSVAYSFAPMVNDALGIETSKVIGESSKQYYTSDYDNIEEMFQAKVELMREVGREGTVLLKNDGLLPVKTGKVTVLGADGFVFATATGGGSMHGEEVIATRADLVTALKNVGLTVSTSESDAASSAAVIVVIGRVSSEGNDVPAGSLSLTAAETTMINAAKSANENVVLLVSGDHVPEIGAYKNDAGIKAIIKFGNAGYRGAYGLADVIAGKASPSGKLVDTWAVSTTSSPAYQNFGDMEYTNSNKVMASQANKYISYNEGIYTDYKYYETRYEDSVLGQGNATAAAGATSGSSWKYSNEVLYSYGYGLSYTKFIKTIKGEPTFDTEKRTATITVNVKNDGDCAGKEVVQIYAQSPYTQYDITNKVEKASVQLMGFGKTGELNPGDDEDVTVTVNMQWLASYDYTKAKTYIMDAGDYYFAVGNGAHDALNNILAAKGKKKSDGMDYDGDASLAYMWHEDELDTTTYATSVYTGATIENRFDDANINYWLSGSDKITYLSRNAWDTTYPEKLDLAATANMLSVLNDTKRYENGKWNDTKSRAKSDAVNYNDYTDESAVNDAVSSGKIDVKNVVAMRGEKYDAECWNEILDTLTVYEMSRMVAQGRYYINACPSVTFNAATGGDGPAGLTKPYKYYSIDKTNGEKTEITDSTTITDGITEDKIKVATMDAGVYSSEPVLAATFNMELAERIGAMYGEDGLYTGTSFLWGLGADMHRTPYGGRVSEYYSSDPVHTTLIGSAVTKASKEHGVVLVVKHFAINEQEQNRIGVATFTNEQALRETYLRAFEGMATYGEMQGMMTAYNRIGLISCTAEYDLCTTVLREEWGSQAYLISDLNSPTAGLYDGNAAIAAGLSTFLNNGTYDATSGAYVNTTLNVASIKADPTLLYATREACHRMLYNYINSNAVNGIDENTRILFVTPWWKPFLITFDVIFAVVAVCATALFVISVNGYQEKIVGLFKKKNKNGEVQNEE